MTVTRRTVLTLLASAAGLGALAGCAKKPVEGDGTAPTPSASASSPSQAPIEPTAPLPDGLFTVLVIGSDTRNENNFKGLSDAIAICQLTPARDHINIVSIARDSYVNGDKINATYARKGPDGLREAVSALLGDLPINATLETTFERFTTGMELLDGITVNNLRASDSFGSTFAQGAIHINGADALNYVRERKGLPNGDFDRTERHRATLTGILDRLHTLATTDAARLATLVPQLYSKVRATDLSIEQARGMLPLLKNLSGMSVTSLMVPISRFANRGGASVVLLDTDMTNELAAALKTGDLSAYVAAHGTEAKDI